MEIQRQARIEVKDLQLPYPVLASNIWKVEKEQPALVSVNITLKHGCQLSASQDVLGEDTMHYGELAKRIRTAITRPLRVHQVLGAVRMEAEQMGKRPNGTSRIFLLVIQLQLPKASLTGERTTFTQRYYFGNNSVAHEEQRQYSVDKMRVGILIGVNDYERQHRQPVIIDLELHYEPKRPELTNSAMDFTDLGDTEAAVVHCITDSFYETLEALVETSAVVAQKSSKHAVSRVKVRIAKPKAIAFADEAAVELVMSWPKQTTSSSAESEAAFEDLPRVPSSSLPAAKRQETRELRIIKPYV